MQKSKSIIITGHSVGGTTASLVSLWLLSYLQQTSISSPLSILCITFGSPLLGNESLSRAILHKKWSGNFCHVVLGNDVVPRLLFAPLESFTSQLHFLLQYWQMSMASPHFAELNTQVLAKEVKAELFLFVLAHVGESARAERSSYWPFGNYLFCSDEGEICVDNAKATVKMLRFMFRMSESGDYGIKEHVKYGDWVEKVSSRFMTRRVVEGEREYSESSYEAGLDLALQSCGISRQVWVVRGSVYIYISTGKRFLLLCRKELLFQEDKMIQNCCLKRYPVNQLLLLGKKLMTCGPFISMCHCFPSDFP